MFLPQYHFPRLASFFCTNLYYFSYSLISQRNQYYLETSFHPLCSCLPETQDRPTVNSLCCCLFLPKVPSTLNIFLCAWAGWGWWGGGGIWAFCCKLEEDLIPGLEQSWGIQREMGRSKQRISFKAHRHFHERMN